MKVDRVWLRSQCDFSLCCEPEEFNRNQEIAGEIITGIEEQLARGNVWAWCSVGVLASWNIFEAIDWLGECSYESEEAFRRSDYYEDMIDHVVRKIAAQIESFTNQHGLWEHDKALCFQCVVKT